MSDTFYQIRPLGQWSDPVTSTRRSASVFKASWKDTLALLQDEIEKVGGQPPVVFQIDVQEGDIRLDGMLRANAKVGHPGVVISFTSKYGPLRYATDAHEQQWHGGLQGWQANIRAIALALQALRAVDRYGVTKRGEQYTGWRAIAGGSGGLFGSADEALTWMGAVAREAGLDAAALLPRDLYRKLALKHHPDVAGDAEIWDRLQEACSLLGLNKEVARRT